MSYISYKKIFKNCKDCPLLHFPIKLLSELRKPRSLSHHFSGNCDKLDVQALWIHDPHLLATENNPAEQVVPLIRVDSGPRTSEGSGRMVTQDARTGRTAGPHVKSLRSVHLCFLLPSPSVQMQVSNWSQNPLPKQLATHRLSLQAHLNRSLCNSYKQCRKLNLGNGVGGGIFRLKVTI